MKKQLSFIWGNKCDEKEKGFVLPYVLFITTLVLIVVTARIHNYEQSIEITHQQIDQIKIETLLQMGLATFKEEHIPNDSERMVVDYTFPDGRVTIISRFEQNMGYHLHVTIVTANQSEYTTLHTIQVAQEDEEE